MNLPTKFSTVFRHYSSSLSRPSHRSQILWVWHDDMRCSVGLWDLILGPSSWLRCTSVHSFFLRVTGKEIVIPSSKITTCKSVCHFLISPKRKKRPFSTFKRKGRPDFVPIPFTSCTESVFLRGNIKHRVSGVGRGGTRCWGLQLIASNINKINNKRTLS